MKETVKVMISSEEIAKRLDQLGAEITKEFKGEQVELICVLKGAVIALTEIAKRIDLPVTLSFMDVSSYGEAMESSGSVKILRDLDEDIEGKNVILVEDIIDTGRTLHVLREMLLKRDPKNFKIFTLLDKPSRRIKEVPVDYTGFSIPDAFVVGYGLDYKQRYRNLDYVGVLNFEEE